MKKRNDIPNASLLTKPEKCYNLSNARDIYSLLMIKSID